ncbi:MAG TPA: HlyD family efflux transporter periplasmic adaptor subunit [Thermoanaerobaculia bacterium]|nr:HlyD family efflux transporter periplasmic adaptor subunit [Thermoanaerobaculia bacterium]
MARDSNPRNDPSMLAALHPPRASTEGRPYTAPDRQWVGAGPRARPRALVLGLALVALAGCGPKAPQADAYGNFEATKVKVAAEIPGRLLEFPVEEGQSLEAGAPVGHIETTSLELQRAELAANREAVSSRTAQVAAQVAVLAEQRRLAETELARVNRLLASEAATPQQQDRASHELAVIDLQIRQAETQRTTLARELDTLAAQLSRLDDQIGRAKISNPIAGTVLAVYAEPHELVAAGQPLYEIADLRTIELRAYVTGADLARITLGAQVEVRIDGSATTQLSLPGEISWISSQAEFTPSTLQTREDRVDLVYAFKVRVANPEGRLKIGMPGEVRLPGARPATGAGA